jgi:hypothetical protein
MRIRAASPPSDQLPRHWIVLDGDETSRAIEEFTPESDGAALQASDSHSTPARSDDELAAETVFFGDAGDCPAALTELHARADDVGSMTLAAQYIDDRPCPAILPPETQRHGNRASVLVVATLAVIAGLAAAIAVGRIGDTTPSLTTADRAVDAPATSQPSLVPIPHEDLSVISAPPGDVAESRPSPVRGAAGDAVRSPPAQVAAISSPLRQREQQGRRPTTPASVLQSHNSPLTARGASTAELTPPVTAVSPGPPSSSPPSNPSGNGAAVETAKTAPEVRPSIAGGAVTPPAAAASTAALDNRSIEGVLERYRLAFSRLDADAARVVWPTTDARALSQAFDQLVSQELAFDACDIRVSGTQATASCRGHATYVPRFGRRSARVDARRWQFVLQKLDNEWLIDNVSAR